MFDWITGRHQARMVRELRLWPMLCLLLLAIIIPTACLLWLMSKAIDNERLAVRQLLTEACREQFVRLHAHWHEHWQALAKRLDGAVGAASRRFPSDAAERRVYGSAFEAILRDGLADSAVCRDAHHRPAYPAPPPSPPEKPPDADGWTRAEQLENAENKPLEAAKLYAEIVAKSSDNDLAARALMAQARCLARSDRRSEAVEILANTLATARFQRATDRDGRLMVADAELRALQLIGDRTDSRFARVRERLTKRLADYSDELLGGAQRRFLMKELARLSGDEFPTLTGEELAASFLESGTVATNHSILQTTSVPGLWQFASAEGRVIALFRTETILAKLQEMATKENLPSGVTVELIPPDRQAELDTFLHVLPAGDFQPGWQLALAWNNEELVNATAGGRIAVYVFAGTSAIVAAAFGALWIALALRRQMRLAGLKNDLLATVSHELKTPLSSIRLLVDTLLDGDAPDRQRKREYLQLIAKENARLSRLIDNFLTFSRMTRNKQTFAFAQTDPAAIVQAAADVVGDRFEHDGCLLTMEIEPNLPPITADVDALIAALVNLLDNAYKYTGDDKQITLRARAEPRGVVFEVSDNGIGLSRTACRRVFQRFYQVDRELSRRQGGCGLGLSIVESIVEAHNGRVSVRSEPEHGSTFAITIPWC